MNKDPYQILGVSKDADDDTIKKAYRKLAMESHPDKDKSPGAAGRFNDISEAYNSIKTKEARESREYVRSPFGNSGFGSEAADFFSRAGRKKNPWGFSAGPNIDSMFEEMIKKMNVKNENFYHSRTATNGSDLRINLGISLEEVATGTKRKIRYKKDSRCSRCPSTDPIRGCIVCGGSGLYQTTDDIEVEIPAGVPDNHVISLRGSGNAGKYGGKEGDLLVSIEVMPNDVFTRNNSDIHKILNILPFEAVLGAQKEVIGICGEIIKLTIPPGTSSGKFFRIPNRGVPVFGGKFSGDLIVKILITVSEMTARELSLYNELRKIHEESNKS